MDENSEIDESLVCWLGTKDNPNPSSVNAKADESLVCWLGTKDNPNPSSSMNANARRAHGHGIYKGFKFISQIFGKERELEIGHPTDVKHVGHIGWESSSSPTNHTWMSELNTSSNFSSKSLSHLLDNDHPSSSSLKVESWSSLDFEQPTTRLPDSDIFQDSPPSDLPKIPRKHKRKKAKSLSSTTESQYPLSNIFRPKTKVTISLGKDNICEKIERNRELR